MDNEYDDEILDTDFEMQVANFNIYTWAMIVLAFLAGRSSLTGGVWFFIWGGLFLLTALVRYFDQMRGWDE